MVLEISSALLARIAAAAAASAEREVCGLLLGTGNRVSAIRPAANVAADPRTRFEIDPATLIAAHRAARGGGPAVIGCYHSHPTGRAEPSPRDAADAAADGQFWLIAGAGAITGWRAVAEGSLHGRFDAVNLIAR